MKLLFDRLCIRDSGYFLHNNSWVDFEHVDIKPREYIYKSGEEISELLLLVLIKGEPYL